MRKSLLVFVLIASAMLIPAPKAKAIDPVTLAILAPIAIKGAQIAAPYVIKGLKSGAVHMVKTGKDMVEIFYLPWGVIQSTVGIPFGGLGPGIKNMVKGGIAPVKMTIDVLMMPLAFCGVSVN